MTNFVVLTLFPEMFEVFVNTSIIKRAIQNNVTSIKILNIRSFTKDKHLRVDFPPCGGGSGMVISCDPLAKSIDYSINYLKEVSNRKIKIIYLSPRGKVLNFNLCDDFSKADFDYILICGHYEGIDERIIEEYDIEEISIGDFVLTGGELPAQVFMDSIIRLLDGAISKDSLSEESHTNFLLEYPQYTKPVVFRGKRVPDILLSGNHKKIEEYRREESIRITKKYRPDLLEKYLNNNMLDKGGKI